ncbi:M24 family metallopeptidase [bacterium]|nr:M24 family metallopeptidase [bacterium]
MSIRTFLNENDLSYLLVNTTNEFLVEYNTLDENSLYKLTNFSGSTAYALVTPETIYLFVDGRYHIQADLEVNHSEVTVVKLQSGQNFLDSLRKILPEGAKLGLFSKKNSVKRVEELSEYYNLVLIENDPYDVELHQEFVPEIIDEELTGMTISQKGQKISQIADIKENEVILLTDLDDISYLFNIRNYSIPYSSKIKGKALVFKNSAELFTPDRFDELEDFLRTTDFKVLIDPLTTNDFDRSIIKSDIYKISNPVRYLRSIKTKEELEHLKDAFSRTDRTMGAIRDYINNNSNISEYDIANKLEQEFMNNGAKGLSFKSIVAKDMNSALAHYSKSSKEEIIKDGSLVLIDCGAYFDGGLATDITRVFVKGEPSELNKKVYTTVLKAFLRGYNSVFRTGFEIDSEVREFLNMNAPEGFVFNHGLGHGIGVNVHEYPPNLSNSEKAKVEIKDGMCFTIEPGLYKEGEFGVRLENSCYFLDGKIHSFVKMNYEQKLINFEMLNEQEKIWLNEFEVK